MTDQQMMTYYGLLPHSSPFQTSVFLDQEEEQLRIPTANRTQTRNTQSSICQWL